MFSLSNPTTTAKFDFFLWYSGNHGCIQLQGHGHEGTEEDSQQHGHQKLCANVYRRHQQRDPGRTVPGLQRVHRKQIRGPEGRQRPGQNRRQDRRAFPKQPFQQWGTTSGPRLQEKAPHGGHDGHQLLWGTHFHALPFTVKLNRFWLQHTFQRWNGFGKVRTVQTAIKDLDQNEKTRV